MLKIAIIGFGKIAADFLSIKHQLNIEISAVLLTEKNLAKAKDITYAKVYTNYDELLEQKFDFVYIALPNHLHFEFAKKALLKKQNVILEKPFCTSLVEAAELAYIATTNNLYLFEAVSTTFLPTFKKLQEFIKEVGDIRLISIDFLQLSSRYANFQQNIIEPAFDKNKAGGALMDLNVYNIHLMIALFGMPLKYSYFANIQKDIDTSGIAILEYDTFKAQLSATKDTVGNSSGCIAGDKAFIEISGPTNELQKVSLNNKYETIEYKSQVHRLIPMWEFFIETYKNSDYLAMQQLLQNSVNVMGVVDKLKVF